MKARELRKKSVEELNQELLELFREQLNLRIQKANDQLNRHTQIKNGRHEIARIKTVLREKERLA